MKRLFSLAYNAFILTHKREFYKYWFSGSLGTTIALFLIGKNIFSLTIEKSIYFGTGLFFIIWILRFTYFFCKITIAFLFSVYKESIYGDAIILLNGAFANIHSFRKNDTFNEEDFKTCLSLMCNNLKLIFDKKTGGNCGVSIKAIVQTNTHLPISADAEIVNLSRDESTLSRNTEKYQNTKHQVFSNSCYNIIFDNISKDRKKMLYYYNNDIPPKRPVENDDMSNIRHSDVYMNTSYDVYENGLPYKSELVCPIIPLISKGKVFNIVGFICVDCDKKNAFDSKYDTFILSGVADGMYDLFTNQIESNLKTK